MTKVGENPGKQTNKKKPQATVGGFRAQEAVFS